MKIVVTGSLGNISKPLTEILVSHGHKVTVISSDAAKKATIEALHASAATGSMEDAAFLTSVFTGADAVYAMIPLSYTAADPLAHMTQIADNYVQAIKQSGIKRVVLLSGWSADLVSEGSLEQQFDHLPGVSLSILRPATFYSNFYMSIDLIKGKGLMGKLLALRYLGLSALLTGKTGLLMGNCGGDDRTVFVAPKDIAAAAAEELEETGLTKKIRYVGSEEMTCNEAARIIGTAVGKPWLKWVLISDKEMLRGLKMAGMPLKMAELLVEMQSAMHNGKPLENFRKAAPQMGKTKLAGFAKEFAVAYHAKKA